MRLFAGLMGVVVLCLLSTGCQNALLDDRNQMYAENQRLRAQIEQMQGQKPAAGDSATVRALRDQLAARDQELAALKNQPVASNPVQPTGFEGMDSTYDPRAGTVTVTLPGDVLFASGQATLKESAKAQLAKLANTVNKQYPGKPIRVEGHTDTDPINKTKDKFTDNLDLSLTRAAEVTRYLESQGVDAKRIGTVGYGEFKPKSPDRKDLNRRVEIVVVVK